jgi:hypothetical protein
MIMASRKQPNNEFGDPHNQRSEGVDEEEAGSVCPVCGEDMREVGACEHLVSWDYGEEGGRWPGKTDPWEIQDVVNALVEALSTGFTERQLMVVKQLLQLPNDLLPPLADSIEEGGFSGFTWTNALGNLITRSPGFIGSARCDNEPSGPGTAGTWTNYWVQNSKTAARWLDKQLRSYLSALKHVEKTASKLPEQMEEE